MTIHRNHKKKKLIVGLGLGADLDAGRVVGVALGPDGLRVARLALAGQALAPEVREGLVGAMAVVPALAAAVQAWGAAEGGPAWAALAQALP